MFQSLNVFLVFFAVVTTFPFAIPVVHLVLNLVQKVVRTAAAPLQRSAEETAVRPSSTRVAMTTRAATVEA